MMMAADRIALGAMAQRAIAAANGIDRLVTRLCRFIVLVTGIALTLILTANVAARYAFSAGGLDMAQELPERLFPWFIVAGVALAAQAGGHMAVDWLLGKLGPRGGRWLILFGNAIIVVAYAILFRQALVLADIAKIEKSPVLGLSGSHGYWAMALGFALIALVTVCQSVRVLLSGTDALLHRIQGDLTMSLIVVLGFCVLMVLAIPVGHALIIAAAGAILWSGTIPVMAVAQTMFQQTQSFPMLALPFFMLAGALMMGGRLGQELLHFATEGMKRWRGGELSTTVVASVAFGGVSGSAVANASALGSILIPWQKSAATRPGSAPPTTPPRRSSTS